MKFLVLLFMALGVVPNCGSASADDREPTPLDMECSGVYYQGGAGITRCVNTEVICYLVDGGKAITCMRRDAQ